MKIYIYLLVGTALCAKIHRLDGVPILAKMQGDRYGDATGIEPLVNCINDLRGMPIRLDTCCVWMVGIYFWNYFDYEFHFYSTISYN